MYCGQRTSLFGIDGALLAPILLLQSSLLVAAPLGAQSAWTKVPRFPNQCYSDKDTFDADIQAARDAMAQAHVRQSDINAALKAKADNLDDATKQSKVQHGVRRAVHQVDHRASAYHSTAEIEEVGYYMGYVAGVFARRRVPLRYP